MLEKSGLHCLLFFENGLGFSVVCARNNSAWLQAFIVVWCVDQLRTQHEHFIL
jgi:hypothetical protein